MPFAAMSSYINIGTEVFFGRGWTDNFSRVASAGRVARQETFTGRGHFPLLHGMSYDRPSHEILRTKSPLFLVFSNGFADPIKHHKQTSRTF
jgi:hypothetical protein